jgi:hypothetical protein
MNDCRNSTTGGKGESKGKEHKPTFVFYLNTTKSTTGFTRQAGRLVWAEPNHNAFA